MLTEEEKKAIEYLKRHIIPYYRYKGRIEFMLNDVILNFIEKLKKENEELHKEIERQGNAREIEEEYIEKKFISKDKIREKMKEVKYLSTAGYEILKELLEEE